MATQSARRRYTYEEFANLPDEEVGYRLELIDGELFMAASPSGPHQILVQGLLVPLCGIFDRPESGVVLQDFDVVFDDDRCVRPDVAVILPDRLDRLTDRCVRGAPSIVVEVLSPGNEDHDHVRKLCWYETYGVLEYWLVYPDRRRIDVYRRFKPDRFADALVLRSGDRLRTPLVPELDVAVDDLYKRLPSPPSAQ